MEQDSNELLCKSLLGYLQKAQQIFLLENGTSLRTGGTVTDSDSTMMVLDAIYRVLAFGLAKGYSAWKWLESIQQIRPVEKETITHLIMPKSNDRQKVLSFIRLALNRKVLSDWITEIAASPATQTCYLSSSIVAQREELDLFLDLISPLRTVNFSLASLEDISEETSPSKGETAAYIAEISKNLSPQKPPVAARRVWGRGSSSLLTAAESFSSLNSTSEPTSPGSRKKPPKRVAVIGDLPDGPALPNKETELDWEEIGNEVARKSPSLPDA